MGDIPHGNAPDPSSDIAQLRKSYELAELDETASDTDPLAQFQRWLAQALDAKLPEPTAMTLATVGADGRPSTRVVLLKGVDPAGLVWYTNYRSRKGQELAVHAQAALQFHWVELERVVRVEGRVEKTDAAQSDHYFASRPLASRIGAWASPQSDVIASRDVLVDGVADISARFESSIADDSLPRPPHWGGYRLQPDRWEFWQGRRSRLHDRLQYRLAAPAADTRGAATATAWVRERLAP